MPSCAEVSGGGAEEVWGGVRFPSTDPDPPGGFALRCPVDPDDGIICQSKSIEAVGGYFCTDCDQDQSSVGWRPPDEDNGVGGGASQWLKEEIERSREPVFEA